MGLGPRAVFFSLAFAVLQLGWQASRGTFVQRFVVHDCTVRPAVYLINILTPTVHAAAIGASVAAAGGGLNIENGCEGLEALFLLMAAFLVAPLAWRSRLLGLSVGSALVFVLNQARILTLFYAYRANLARPVVVGNRILYPLGTHGVPDGGFQVTNTVGGVLQLPALLLMIALAWPARRASELAVRLGIALPVTAAVVLLDTPFTAVAELRNGLATAIDPRTVDSWMVASRFLMGGGGYALMLPLTAGSIACARWCLRRGRASLRSVSW